jgi:hypothetical protein
MVHEGGRTWTSCGWVEGGVEEVSTSETRRNSEDVAGEAERWNGWDLPVVKRYCEARPSGRNVTAGHRGVNRQIRRRRSRPLAKRREYWRRRSPPRRRWAGGDGSAGGRGGSVGGSGGAAGGSGGCAWGKWGTELVPTLTPACISNRSVDVACRTAGLSSQPKP